MSDKKRSTRKEKQKDAQKLSESKEKQTPHDIHDSGYKMLFSFWKVFQQLMEGYVPQEWKDRLDYAQSERINKSFILKGLEKRESDILYKVPILGQKDKPVFLYVLIEHQSTVDYSLAFRVLVYLVSFWKDYYKNTPKKLRKQKSFRLPPVFPIVLYNGKDSWTAATSVKEIVEQGDLFTDFVPNVRYHLVDISKLNQEKLKRRGKALEAIFLLEHEMNPEEIEAAFRDALEIVYKETDEELVKAMIEWICIRLRRLFPGQAEQIIEKIDLAKYDKQEVRTMLETMPSKLVAFGRSQQMKESIITVLEARFQNVSQDVRDVVNHVANSKDLERLLKKAAMVGSLQAFASELAKFSGAK